MVGGEGEIAVEAGFVVEDFGVKVVCVCVWSKKGRCSSDVLRNLWIS